MSDTGSFCACGKHHFPPGISFQKDMDGVVHSNIRHCFPMTTTFPAKEPDAMSDIQPGVRVKAAINIEGTAIGVTSKEVTIRLDDAGMQNALVHPDAVTVIAPAVPPEPPEGSVVIDRDGDAWQRRPGNGWYPSGARVGKTWTYLNFQYGPLTIIHTAKAPADWECHAYSVVKRWPDLNAENGPVTRLWPQEGAP